MLLVGFDEALQLLHVHIMHNWTIQERPLEVDLEKFKSKDHNNRQYKSERLHPRHRTVSLVVVHAKYLGETLSYISRFMSNNFAVWSPLYSVSPSSTHKICTHGEFDELPYPFLLDMVHVQVSAQKQLLLNILLAHDNQYQHNQQEFC